MSKGSETVGRLLLRHNIIIITIQNRGDGGGPERPHHVKKTRTTCHANLFIFTIRTTNVKVSPPTFTQHWYDNFFQASESDLHDNSRLRPAYLSAKT